MPKALKISGFDVTEIEVDDDAFIQDREFKERDRLFDSHYLARPEKWDGKKFRLAFVCWDTFKEEDTDFNILGTYLYRMLKHPLAILDDVIPGPVYLINEDDEGFIDFTIQDLEYIWNQSTSFDQCLTPEKVEFMSKVRAAILINFHELETA
jgi:hypothetical protein